MAGGNKELKSTSPIKEVSQVADTAAKGVASLNASLAELTKHLAEMQKISDDNVAKSASILTLVNTNTANIEKVSKTTSENEERTKMNSANIAEMESRIATLENRQRIARELDDAESQVQNLQRRIGESELTTAASCISLVGLPLPLESSSISDTSNEIGSTIAKALGKDTAQFIFATKDNSFLNIQSWAKMEPHYKQFYSKTTPEESKNSLIFYTDSRLQAIHLENRLRAALISTQNSRSDGPFAGLELGLYLESPRARALQKLLLHKGRVLTSNIKELSQYRVIWKGGLSRQSKPHLVLECKASKEYINQRRAYFYKDELICRSTWTQDSNIFLSSLDNIFFPPKPPAVQLSERQVVAISTKQSNSEKRPRQSPGTAGNLKKQGRLNIVPEGDASDDEEENDGNLAIASKEDPNAKGPGSIGKTKKNGPFPRLNPLKESSQRKISDVFGKPRNDSKADQLAIPSFS